MQTHLHPNHAWRRPPKRGSQQGDHHLHTGVHPPTPGVLWGCVCPMQEGLCVPPDATQCKAQLLRSIPCKARMLLAMHWGAGAALIRGEAETTTRCVIVVPASHKQQACVTQVYTQRKHWSKVVKPQQALGDQHDAQSAACTGIKLPQLQQHCNTQQLLGQHRVASTGVAIAPEASTMQLHLNNNCHHSIDTSYAFGFGSTCSAVNSAVGSTCSALSAPLALHAMQEKEQQAVHMLRCAV